VDQGDEVMMANNEPGEPNIRKEEPTFVHNARQILGCLPVLGSSAVGIAGIWAFFVGMDRTGHPQTGAFWLIGSSIGLIASGIGFGVLGWVVWSNRRE
jgi:hypothetical protein